jgi:hypothetical protein
MAALTEGRNTPEALGDVRSAGVAAGTTLFPGAIVMINAAGFLVEGQTATGLIGVGRSESLANNAGGSNGDITGDYKPGTYRVNNSAGADEITDADRGKPCYAVDDQTVAKTDGTASRSPAGIVDHVDAHGVWVTFDVALTRAATA